MQHLYAYVCVHICTRTCMCVYVCLCYYGFWLLPVLRLPLRIVASTQAIVLPNQTHTHKSGWLQFLDRENCSNHGATY